MRAKRAVKDAKDREGAEAIARVLVSKVITIVARAGDGGKLFGSVTSTEVAAAVATQSGIELERKAIHLDEHIKSTGTHQVQVRLHSDVEFPLTVELIAPGGPPRTHLRGGPFASQGCPQPCPQVHPPFRRGCPPDFAPHPLVAHSRTEGP